MLLGCGDVLCTSPGQHPASSSSTSSGLQPLPGSLLEHLHFSLEIDTFPLSPLGGSSAVTCLILISYYGSALVARMQNKWQEGNEQQGKLHTLMHPFHTAGSGASIGGEHACEYRVYCNDSFYVMRCNHFYVYAA